ncbi:putative mediator of RNA polymerase II transcription subunit [Xylariaceae sp. FL0804]|nr:putative mediator of RNA polymerase II transcription subunit [Xylariaceae sp. FL0804]
MAPMPRNDHNVLEQQLKDTIQSLHNVMVQVSAYDATSSPPTLSSSGDDPLLAPGGAAAVGSTTTTTTTTAPISSPSPSTSTRPSRDVLSRELAQLSRSLQRVHASTSSSSSSQQQQQLQLPHIPPELVQYVDNGRNPDIYTREFVELVRRGNQLLRGRRAAFAGLRDAIAAAAAQALPELRPDVDRVLRRSGEGGAAAATATATATTTTTTTTAAGAGAGEGPAAAAAAPGGPAAVGGGGGGVVGAA